MAERRLIFNAKGFQLGYIEGNAVFDLSGRRRCSYTGATGNLGDFDSGKILGHISLDGTFVGASWLSEDLFGKPRGEAHPDRLVKVQGPHSRKVRGAYPCGESNHTAPRRSTDEDDAAVSGPARACGDAF